MPELPDILLYVERLGERLVGRQLLKFKVHNPFVLRSLGRAGDLDGLTVAGISRLGKRLVIELEGERFIVIHLMVSGRLSWTEPLPDEKAGGGKALLATWRFENGQLQLQEHSTKKRASINLVTGKDELAKHRREGLDIFSISIQQFATALKAQNRTLKRALTDPHTFDGIGNAYSDEILFAARLSPVRTTNALTEEEIARLHEAAKTTLTEWAEKLKKLYPDFPKPAQITAFRKDFAVHGKFNQPCPVCASPIQHIVYADNETNYCARCQNEGRLLADRSLSRLLKDDWPKNLDELS